MLHSMGLHCNLSARAEWPTIISTTPLYGVVDTQNKRQRISTQVEYQSVLCIEQPTASQTSCLSFNTIWHSNEKAKGSDRQKLGLLFTGLRYRLS